MLSDKKNNNEITIISHALLFLWLEKLTISVQRQKKLKPGGKINKKNMVVNFSVRFV
jgi:hypothetical protein